MNPDPIAAALDRTDLTTRDQVLGALMSALHALKQIEQLPAHQDHAHDAVSALLVLQAIVNTRGLRIDAECYGLPGWLVEGGLVKMLERLTASPLPPAWRAASDYFGRGSFLGELLDLAEQLKSENRVVARQVADLTRSLHVAEQNLAVGALAAGATITSSQANMIGRAAVNSCEPLLKEAAIRLRRFDFPVIAPDSLDAVLLGADVILEEGDGEGVTLGAPEHDQLRLALYRELQEVLPEGVKKIRWRPWTDDFANGLHDAQKAVLKLLTELGAPRSLRQEARQVLVSLRGVLPIAETTGRSAGLPFALHVLGLLGDMPVMSMVASGPVGPDGILAPLHLDEARSKLAAVQADGIRDQLLAHVPDAAASPVPGLVCCGGTLRAAAAAAWGASWEAWTSGMLDEALRKAHVVRGWKEPLRPRRVVDSDIRPVDTWQASEIVEILKAAREPETLIVSGPAHTGKSWIAQEVEQLLHDSGWNVHVLRCDELDSPALDPVWQLLKISGRYLLIVDDLQCDEENARVFEDLREIAEKSGAHILAVARVYERERASDFAIAELTRDGWRVVPPIIGEGVRDFANALISANPGLATARATLGAVLDRAGADISALVALMREPNSSEAGPLVDGSYLSVGDLGHTVADDVKRVAALSYLRIPTPEWFLDKRSGEALGRCGAQHTDGRWTIRSRYACEKLLSQAGVRLKSSELRARCAEVVHVFLNRAAKDRRHEDVLFLIRKLSVDADDVLAAALDVQRDAVDDWFDALPDGLLRARALNLLSDYVDVGVRRRWTRQTAMLVAQTSSAADFNAGTLAEVISAIEPSLLRAGNRNEAEQQAWNQLVATLQVILPKALAETATVAARRRLLRAIWKMRARESDELLVRLGEHFVRWNVPPLRADHCWLALEYLEFTDQTRKVPETVMSALASLAKIRPTTAGGYGFEALLAQMALNDTIGVSGPWDEVVDQRLPELLKALRQSRLAEIARGLRFFARFNRSLAVKLTHRLDRDKAKPLARAFTQQSGLARPEQVAAFLDTIGKLHARAAHELLYENDSPRRPLIERFSAQIRNERDARGAGMLLRAAHRVDAALGSIDSGFAHALAESLGSAFFRARLTDGDPRLSYVYHLMDGLVAAEPSFASEIVSAAVEAVKHGVSQPYRPWAPRLALLIASHHQIGETFLSLLASEAGVSRFVLLDAMRRSRTTESLAYYHELASFLYPDLAHEYVKAPEHQRFRWIQQPGRPEVVVRAALAVATTFRRAGANVAPLLDGLRPDWALLIQQALTDDDVAEALRGLARLDSPAALDVVITLKEHLVRRVRRALRRPDRAAELLDAIEEVRPGAGAEIHTRFQSGEGRWRAAMEELAFEQDPRLFAIAFQKLARVGYVPSEHMIQNLTNKWIGLAWEIHSPAALAGLLRLFATWDPSLATKLSAAMNSRSIAYRLRRGAQGDLSYARNLIGGLFATGADELATTYTEALLAGGAVVERLSLQSAQELLACVRLWMPQRARELAGQCASAAEKAARAPFVRDDIYHWLTIGWAAWWCRSEGVPVDVPDEPTSFQFRKPAAVRAWATAWLDAPWAKDTVLASLDELAGRPPATSEAAAGALIVASHRGTTEQLLGARNTDWSHAADAGPSMLLPLLQCALSDQALRAALEPRLIAAGSRVARPEWNAESSAPLLKDLLQELLTGEPL